MNQERFNIFESELGHLMLSHMGKSITLPQIEACRLHMGTMQIQCSKRNTIKWLRKYIPSIDKNNLWNGANLEVIDSQEVIKPYNFNVWIRNIKMNPQEILALLEAQNQGIFTKSWTIIHSEITSEGTALTIGVNYGSFKKLKARSYSLFCSTSKATFVPEME